MNLTAQWHVTAPGAPDFFCRRQNPASKSFKVTGDSISSGSGIDHLVLFGDRNNPVKLDYLIVSGPDGRLLADDQRCTGRDRQTTSLYAANLVACGPNS